ncbi:hypothetical protein SOV_43220 [Sporomusa ovata DSM 2662]|uniref:DUF4097 domain-containing protein n=1 Tax=Sporomusa ovata TaxID=2378 RepID=A0A0U1KVU6_9FIRM|nr:DUF4097 family beta strand repeat-containing protein [Sporomusa ovata]EQB26710.1 hypothetical protein SOV_3c05840 [Sporomusa ovata DSM 2662]CQR70804.1 hypothetical protein SpAn4DRAFT_1782 [Sporomusa ovata]
MDRVLKKISIIAAVVLMIGLSGNAALFMFGQRNGTYMAAGQTRISDTYMVKSSAAKNLEIAISSGDVRVLRSDVAYPTIRISGWSPAGNLQTEDLVQEEMRGDILYLKIGNQKKWLDSLLFPFWGKGPKISFELLLPPQEYDALTLHLSSGSLVIDSLGTGLLKVTMSSGRLEMGNCKADEISVIASSGHVELKNTTGKLTVESSSGHVEVSLNELVNDAVFQSESGYLAIHVGAVSTPFRVEAMALSGKVDVDLPKAGYQVHGTNSFQGHSGQGDGPLVKVAVSSGHARIW